ncbi:uncharacterized protein ACIB01_013965 [Guaruba guarouba]
MQVPMLLHSKEDLQEDFSAGKQSPSEPCGCDPHDGHPSVQTPLPAIPAAVLCLHKKQQAARLVLCCSRRYARADATTPGTAGWMLSTLPGSPAAPALWDQLGNETWNSLFSPGCQGPSESSSPIPHPSLLAASRISLLLGNITQEMECLCQPPYG